MRRPFLNRSVMILGQSMPMAAFALIVFVVAGSALLALTTRLGAPALSLATLSPALILRGQFWRMVTWAFFEVDGQNLIFGSLMLGIFGRDLAGLWGGARYLIICSATALLSGLLTTALGLVWNDVYAAQYLSIWPLADALIVAWAMLFPSRTILFMFMIPASGRNLLYLTVGMAGLFAIMYGVSSFAPHFLAMAIMYAYIRGGTVLAAQLRLNRLLNPRRTNSRLKGLDGGWNKGNGNDPRGSSWVH